MSFEDEENCSPNMNLKMIIGVVAAVAAVTLGVVLNQPRGFREEFMQRCEEFTEGNKTLCEQILNVFEQAYVGKPSCNVAVSAYDPLMTTVPFTHSCSKTMFWSKTKDLVHVYTSKNKDCFTLEDTLLGYCLDGRTWCGKEGSNETFTSGCPKWNKCENNPVRSFWNRASAGFADHACGEASVMLDGSLEKPFNPTSTFATIEIKTLRAPKVTSLNVIVVPGEKSNCNSPDIKTDLRNALDPKVNYICKEVQKSQIEECSSVQNMGCAACLLKTID